MTKAWSDMSERERDAALHHKAFGRHIEYGPIPCPDGRAGCMVAHMGYTSEGVPIPSYTTSLDAMRLVEGVIEETGLQRRYLEELATLQEHRSIACDLDCLAYEDAAAAHALWGFVCATAALRASAAYTVLKENHATPT